MGSLGERRPSVQLSFPKGRIPIIRKKQFRLHIPSIDKELEARFNHYLLEQKYHYIKKADGYIGILDSSTSNIPHRRFHTFIFKA